MSWDDETTVFEVVINGEEQYSIWPDYKPIPSGWAIVGRRGSKRECLAYIKEHWIDMRPLSLRARQAVAQTPEDESHEDFKAEAS